MKQTRYFRTLAESSAFAQGLSYADDGHIHSIRIGQSTSAHLLVNPYWARWVDENKKVAELPEKHPPLTSQQYATRNHPICPICRGRDVTGDMIEVDGRQAFQLITCLNPDCEASWTDCYELSGYDNLER